MHRLILLSLFSAFLLPVSLRAEEETLRAESPAALIRIEMTGTKRAGKYENNWQGKGRVEFEGFECTTEGSQPLAVTMKPFKWGGEEGVYLRNVSSEEGFEATYRSTDGLMEMTVTRLRARSLSRTTRNCTIELEGEATLRPRGNSIRVPGAFRLKMAYNVRQEANQMAFECPSAGKNTVVVNGSIEMPEAMVRLSKYECVVQSSKYPTGPDKTGRAAIKWARIKDPKTGLPTNEFKPAAIHPQALKEACQEAEVK